MVLIDEWNYDFLFENKMMNDVTFIYYLMIVTQKGGHEVLKSHEHLVKMKQKILIVLA